MSGMNTGNTSLLRRAEVWSGELKDVLEEDLMAAGYVKLITEFPDGDEFKIPSIGDARTDDYVEDEAVKYRPMDTGQFQFEITEYVSSGTYITKKAEQDMYYMNQLVSSFVPKQRRAIMERYEADVFAKPEAAYTANQQGEINGAYHRMSGGNSGRLELQDFAYAMYSLKKAKLRTSCRMLPTMLCPSVMVPPTTTSRPQQVSQATSSRLPGMSCLSLVRGVRCLRLTLSGTRTISVLSS
jgi:hypothetical protein